MVEFVEICPRNFSDRVFHAFNALYPPYEYDGYQLRLDGHYEAITQGKILELEHNQGCFGEFETAFDGEMEAMADIMEFVDSNQIPGDLTIHSDAQAAMARVGHTGTGRGHGRAIRVVKAVQLRKEPG
jgi:hypothetical protein